MAQHIEKGRRFGAFKSNYRPRQRGAQGRRHGSTTTGSREEAIRHAQQQFSEREQVHAALRRAGLTEAPSANIPRPLAPTERAAIGQRVEGRPLSELILEDRR